MTRKKQSKRGLRVCCLMGCMVLLFSQPFGISAQQTEQGGPGKVSAADSQQFISGKVIDASGVPIIGATVHLKDSKNVAVTDMDGNFSIKSDQKYLEFLISVMMPWKRVLKGINLDVSF